MTLLALMISASVLWMGPVLTDKEGGGAVLLSILPVSLGGWGLREAGMVSLFASVGVPAESVLAMSMVWGLLPLLVWLPPGLLWWATRHSPIPANVPERADCIET